MAGAEVFLEPLAGILGGLIPMLQIVFLLAIVGLVLFIFWKRQPFKPWHARVLVKHRRGKDYTPEMTEGRREKKEGQWGYKLRNGAWIPQQYFKDIRTMGKKAFLEVWENEAGKYIPAPSPFDTEQIVSLCPKCGNDVGNGKTCSKCGEIEPINAKVLTGVKNDPEEFTQTDVNWLVDQHKSNIRMFEKKSFLKEWLPIIMPAIGIVIVVLALVLFVTQVFIPLTGQAQAIAESNAHSAELWYNVTSMWAATIRNQSTNGIENLPPIVIPGE